MRRVVIGWTPVEWRTANEITLRQIEDMIELQREQEHMIETLLQPRDRIRVDYDNFTEVPDIEWTEKRPKRVKIAYFIS